MVLEGGILNMSREHDEKHLAQGEKNELGMRVYRKGGNLTDKFKFWWYRRQMNRASYYFFGRKTLLNPILSVQHHLTNNLRALSMNLKMAVEWSHSEDEYKQKVSVDAYRRHEESVRKMSNMIDKLFKKYVKYADIDVGREEID